MAATPIKIFIKAPIALLDYALRWRKWLKGDVILTSTWAISPGGGVVASGVLLGGDVTVAWLSAGTDGISYLVTNTITTLGGRVDSRTIQISVRAR